ncbi:MAG TPA: DUF6734 family protein [Chryseolinea sp.]|nr:DUF6734 family protein [Chryseolinea sp.]
MNIIQSFWSKPSFHSIQNYNNSRKFGGWLNFKYFLISTAYSCLTIRKQHKRLKLYTDSNGQGLFVDLMNLPYDDVSLSLNNLENEDHKLWILGKMMAIKDQSQPFIHVDNDLYLWEPLPQNPSPNHLISQSRVPIWGEYRSSLNEIFANFPFVPECLNERPTAKTMVANVGIVGGNDIDFFQEFCEISQSLLEKNRQYLPLVDAGGFNQMMEEYLFTSLARFKGREIYYLLESNAHDFPPSYLNLNLVPIVYKYIHLIGLNKQNHFYCEQLSLRLGYEFPEQYKKVTEVINEIQDFEYDHSISDRQNRILHAIRICYNYSLPQVEKMKIRIVDGIEIVPVFDYLDPERRYMVKETDVSSGNVIYRSLPYFSFELADYWLKYFADTTSLAAILDGIKHEHNFNDDQEFQMLKYRLVNTITGNLVLVGIMEFV